MEIEADGVTAFEAADAGPLPLGLDAATVNVYDEPLVRPWIVAFVGAGDPDTVVGMSGKPPEYGVTVYEVTGPPEDGGLQVTKAEPLPALAFTLVTCPGGGDGEKIGSTQ